MAIEFVSAGEESPISYLVFRPPFRMYFFAFFFSYRIFIIILMTTQIKIVSPFKQSLIFCNFSLNININILRENLTIMKTKTFNKIYIWSCNEKKKTTNVTQHFTCILVCHGHINNSRTRRNIPYN